MARVGASRLFASESRELKLSVERTLVRLYSINARTKVRSTVVTYCAFKDLCKKEALSHA